MGENAITDPDVSHPEMLRQKLGLPELEFTDQIASGVQYAKANAATPAE